MDLEASSGHNGFSAKASRAPFLFCRLPDDKAIVVDSRVLLALTLPPQTILPLLAADDFQPHVPLLLTRRILECSGGGGPIVRCDLHRTAAAAFATVGPSLRVVDYVLVGVRDFNLGVGVRGAGAVNIGQPGEQDVPRLDERQLCVVPLAGAEDVAAVVRVQDCPVVSVGTGDERPSWLVTGDIDAGFLSRFKSSFLAWI